MAANADITLFHYPFSPWARKVRAYLAFRGFSYNECHQPFTMPRPDLDSLGIKYRRIPVLSIGRDIYCDTLIILEKLEELFPVTASEASPVGAAAGTSDKALEKLLEKWTDVVVFGKAVEAIPPEIYQDIPGFIKDREHLWGRSWKPGDQNKKRPEALAVLRSNFVFLETTILADGRDWILGSQKPKLADIHGSSLPHRQKPYSSRSRVLLANGVGLVAAWIFDWLFELEGAMPDSLFSEKIFPKTIAWRNRYRSAVASATNSAPKPTLLQASEAIEHIETARFGEQEGAVDKRDPLSMHKGAQVGVWPIDTGFRNREVGKLVTLTEQEVALSTKTKNGVDVRIHCPRWNFRIREEGATNEHREAGGDDLSIDHNGLSGHGGDEGLGAEHYHERH